MWHTIQAFLSSFPYNAQAVACFEAAHRRLCDDTEGRELLTALCAAYRASVDIEYDRYLSSLATVAERTGVPVYTANFVLVAQLAALCREAYQREGLEDALYVRTMSDLFYKCEECRLVHGVYGTFVPTWFWNFFRLSRFAFGPLQFECGTLTCDCVSRGVPLPKGERVLCVHIPRTGGRLLHEAVTAAYREAGAFFAERYGLTRIVFTSHTWLFYPEHRQMLSPESNLMRFMSDYDIVEHGDYKDYSHVWRLFDKQYVGDADALPADTSLRRAYLARIRQGLPLGWGYGVYFFGDLQ